MPVKKSTGTKKDPCWKGYEQKGLKKKSNKLVPNCVPQKYSKKK